MHIDLFDLRSDRQSSHSKQQCDDSVGVFLLLLFFYSAINIPPPESLPGSDQR